MRSLQTKLKLMSRNLPMQLAMIFIVINAIYFLIVDREVSEVRSADIEAQNQVVFAQRYEQLTDKMREKVEEMVQDVNDSVLTNKANFPGNVLRGYIEANPNICRDVNIVDLVIIVHTAPGNFKRRQRMRDTFANQTLFLPFHVRIAFLLGNTKDRDMYLKMMHENNNHHDSVIGDFYDHYRNLTIKGVLGYRWVGEHCSNARFVLKIDDDVVVNTYKILYSLANHIYGKKKSMFCNVWHKGTMPILREKKWKIKDHIFPNHEMYPYNYCSGFVVIFTTDLMKPLSQAAHVSPYFWVDDVYLFGMLPHVVGGVTYYDHSIDKSLTIDDKKFTNCTVTLGVRCPFFATTISDEFFWALWYKIKAMYDTTIWNVEKRYVE